MAITTTKFPSGYQTTFDEIGASPPISGCQLIGGITFSGAVATIQVQMWLAGQWANIAADITSDVAFADWTQVVMKRDYQFRFNCSAYTSGTVTVNYDAPR